MRGRPARPWDDQRAGEACVHQGDIEPGIVYSTSCTEDPEPYELNVDPASFDGGFLDGFHRGQRFDERALLVSFTKPVRAFGFDTNGLMGRTFTVRVVHTDGQVELIDGLEVSAPSGSRSTASGSTRRADARPSAIRTLATPSR